MGGVQSLPLSAYPKQEKQRSVTFALFVLQPTTVQSGSKGHFAPPIASAYPPYNVDFSEFLSSVATILKCPLKKTGHIPNKVRAKPLRHSSSLSQYINWRLPICCFLPLSPELTPCHSIISSFKSNKRNKTLPIPAASEAANGVPLFPVYDQAGSAYYYSPCHAGCRYANVTHCDCVAEGFETSYDWCKDDCRWLSILVFVLTAFTAFTIRSGIILATLLTVRSIPDELRSVTLGFNASFVNLLTIRYCMFHSNFLPRLRIGTFPSPLVYGTLLDNACLRWNKSCNIRGACVIYDADEMRLWFVGLCALMRFLSALADCISWIYARNVKLFEVSKKEFTDD
ncbi:OATP domain containing protein [Trichuris trichiura]|uniref:OATP domain containing protein n=1 Tax=Trichuris trichiura TaxID=36087 RepID=A0A077Z7M2_TRITR|nr:OATP domain containing protein [Trichuris trichiura]